MHTTSLILAEEFYDNLDEIVNEAMRCQFQPFAPGVGRLSVDPVKNQKSQQKIEQLLQCKIAWPKEAPCGFFRLDFAGDAWQMATHFGAYDFAAVIYLRAPQFSEQGFSLWKHCATQTIRWPEADIPAADWKVKDKWEQFMPLPANTNRLLIVDAKQYFSCHGGFGDTPNNGMLTQILCFNKA